MVRVNSSFQYVDANASFLNLMGYILSELKMLGPTDITLPEDKHLVSNNVVSISNDHELATSFEKRNVTKAGKVITVRVYSQAIVDSETGEIHLIGMIQDITALKEAENLLVERQMQMIQTSKLSALGEMAGGIAHEINNPLAIILGKVDKLKSVYENDRNNGKFQDSCRVCSTD